jgi:chemotaxis protein MotB
MTPMSGRRERQSEDGPATNVGMVMSVSLFLIILTFFILLCSIAVIDQAKTRVAIGSLIGSFGSLPKGLSPLNTGRSIMPLSAPITPEETGIDRLISEIDRETLGKVKIEKMGDRQIITVDADLLFEPDSHRLKPTSSVLLDKLGRFIGNGDYPVEIIGHTDNTSADVKWYRSNWELSGLAALEVLKYFVTQGRIAPSRLVAYGAGSEQPIMPNATRESRQKNKRIEIVLYDEAAKSLKKLYEGKPKGLFIYKRFDFKVF